MTVAQTTKREDYPTSEDFPTLTGKQSPLYLREAPGDHEHGRKNIELAKRAGFKAMPWQQNEVNAINATNPDGTWTHSDAILIASRQNGKSMIVALIVLYRIFILGQNVLFTAQQWDTAKELWGHTWNLVKGRKFLSKMVTSYTCSQGRGTIVLNNGGRVVFTTRSKDAGRGLTKTDLLIYDESYNLTDGEIAALSFLSQAADDPQVFFMSSAVYRDFPQHQNGKVLSAMRAQALEEWDGDDPVYLSEYAAPTGLDPEDEDTWRQGNPSYGVISNAKKMRNIMKRMTTKEGRINFGVEALGWGSWFDEGTDEEFFPIVDLDRWESLAVSRPVRVGERVLAVEVSPDGGSVALVSAGQTSRGAHLQVCPSPGAFTVDGTAAAIRRFVDEYKPASVLLDKDSPAAVLVPALLRLGIDPVQIGGGQVAASLRSFEQMAGDRKVTHDGHGSWLEALQVATKRGEDTKFPSIERFSGDVSVLVAATFAVWGLDKYLSESGAVFKQVEEKKKNPPGLFPTFSTRPAMGGVLGA